MKEGGFLPRELVLYGERPIITKVNSFGSCLCHKVGIITGSSSISLAICCKYGLNFHCKNCIVFGLFLRALKMLSAEIMLCFTVKVSKEFCSEHALLQTKQ